MCKQVINKRIDDRNGITEYTLKEYNLIGDVTMKQTMTINNQLRKIVIDTDKFINGYNYTSSRRMCVFDILDMDVVKEYCNRLDNCNNTTVYTRMYTSPWSNFMS